MVAILSTKKLLRKRPIVDNTRLPVRIPFLAQPQHEWRRFVWPTFPESGTFSNFRTPTYVAARSSPFRNICRIIHGLRRGLGEADIRAARLLFRGEEAFRCFIDRPCARSMGRHVRASGGVADRRAFLNAAELSTYYANHFPRGGERSFAKNTIRGIFNCRNIQISRTSGVPAPHH